MIWAVDQDDDGFNALQGLTNKNVDSVIPESDLMGEFDISRCYITECGGECPRQSGLKEMVCHTSHIFPLCQPFYLPSLTW